MQAHSCCADQPVRSTRDVGRMNFLTAVMVAPVLLNACGTPVAREDSYFPMQEGHRWTYEVRTEWENLIIERETLVMSSHGKEAIEGGEAFRRRSDDGINYWLRQDDSGIYRVATKSDLQAEPQLDKSKRYVLKQPLALGSSWQSNTTAYLLHRRHDFPREIKHSHPNIPMVYSIEAVGEALTSRAGEFKDCLRVRGDASVRLYADPVVGWRDLPLTTREWYCKGVGLVRLTRDEPAGTTFLGGGKLTMELLTWQ
jgi:hypothetical protein